MNFKYLNEKIETAVVINKSTFITYLFPLSNKEEIKVLLDQLKTIHPKANHYCYGWLLNDNRLQKYSDDGEPAKTAGYPIIDVLIKNNMDDILAVVVRYFGGIKLGAGGLTRAYRSCVAEALNNAKLVEKIEVPIYQIAVDYSLGKVLESYLKSHCVVVEVAYKEKVEFSFYCHDSNQTKAISELTGGVLPVVIAKTKVAKIT